MIVTKGYGQQGGTIVTQGYGLVSSIVQGFRDTIRFTLNIIRKVGLTLER